MVFIGDDGTRYEATGALGPDRQIITVPKQITGRFEVYAEDGSTVILKDSPGTLIPGAVYALADGK